MDTTNVSSFSGGRGDNSIARLAATTAATFRAVANRSWQEHLIGNISVLPSELGPATAFLPHVNDVFLSADVVLNFDWLDTVYKPGLARIDTCLTLSVSAVRRFPVCDQIRIADVSLLRVGTDHHGYGSDCTDRGIAAFAGGEIGYCEGTNPDEMAVDQLLVKLHRSRIHDFDYPGCFYARRRRH